MHAAADGERAAASTSDVDRRARAAVAALPAGHAGTSWRSTTRRVVSESIREVVTTLLEAIGLVVLVMFLFLQDWRTHADPGDHDPGLAHRHVRLRQAVRLLDQHADAVRHHARDRPRRRRCDRRDREHRAAHPRVRRRPPREAASEAMGEVVGAGHRDRAGAGRRVRAGGVLPGHDRPALPAVRADDRLLDGDFGVQRADADAGAVGAAAARREAARACSSAPSTGSSTAARACFVAVLRVLVRVRALVVARVRRRCLGADLLGRTRACRPASCPTRIRATSSSRSRRRSGASLDYTMDIARQVEQIAAEACREINGVFGVGGFSFAGSGAEPGHPVRQAEAFDERPGEAHSAKAVIRRSCSARSARSPARS